MMFKFITLFMLLTLTGVAYAQDTPQPSTDSLTYYINARSARVRLQPNTTSRSVTRLTRGFPVTVVETVEGSEVSGSRTWYKIKWNLPDGGQVTEGYVHSSLVTTKQPIIVTPIPSNTGSGGFSYIQEGTWTLNYELGSVAGPCSAGALTRPIHVRHYSLVIENNGRTVTATLINWDNWGATYGQKISLERVDGQIYSGVGTDEYGYSFNHSWTFKSTTEVVGQVTFTQGSCSFTKGISGKLD